MANVGIVDDNGNELISGESPDCDRILHLVDEIEALHDDPNTQVGLAIFAVMMTAKSYDLSKDWVIARVEEAWKLRTIDLA